MAIKSKSKPGGRAIGYAKDILAIAPNCDAFAVEDVMRTINGTLDHMTRAKFKKEVLHAVNVLDAVKSLGLTNVKHSNSHTLGRSIKASELKKYISPINAAKLAPALKARSWTALVAILGEKTFNKNQYAIEIVQDMTMKLVKITAVVNGQYRVTDDNRSWITHALLVAVSR